MYKIVVVLSIDIIYTIRYRKTKITDLFEGEEGKQLLVIEI